MDDEAKAGAVSLRVSGLDDIKADVAELSGLLDLVSRVIGRLDGDHELTVEAVSDGTRSRT